MNKIIKIFFIPCVFIIATFFASFQSRGSWGNAEAGQLYAKYAIMDYSNSTGLTMDWINKNFSLKVGGNNPNNINMLWMGYYDVLGPQSISEWLKLKDWAELNSVIAESVLMHSKVNFISSINPSWVQADKFDNFEGVNGVLLEPLVGSFIDKSAVAYSGASPYTTINANLYIGYEEPFDRVVFDVRTAASNLIGTWQYWNGTSWVTLAVTDGASSMTKDGTVYFSVPSNWSKISINSSRNKYFIRFAYASATVKPVINTIKGDNWLNGANNAVRGWDGLSGSIINAGTPLAYNPTPPAGALARFPYQARIPYWSANRYVANPADFQAIDGSSKRTWSQFLAFRINQLAVQSGYSGIMGDDAGSIDSFSGIKSINTDFVDKTSNSWATENLNKYSDLVVALRTLNNDVKIGANGQIKSLVSMGDWNLAEYHTFVKSTSSSRGILIGDAGTANMTYDDYLSDNNLSKKFGLLIYDDTLSTIVNGAVSWDRSNRGPMAALTKHLIAANENTYFSYYSRGGFVYDETDQVVLTDNSVVRLATQPIPPLAKVKRWGTWFPAMGIDVGIPDVNGWNSGVRSFTWKLGANIGGGLDVWRRDFTNAIILHRPAMWNTTALQYSTPSTPIDLEGTYYPLYADGTNGDSVVGITSISLRHGEGAILLKYPNQPPASLPPPPSSPKNLFKK